MTVWQVLLIIAVVAAIPLGLRLLHRIAWTAWFRTKPAGPETPASTGLPFEEHWINVDGRRLQAWYVPAPGEGRARAALLLFQGGNDTISEMGELLKYVHDHGLASLAFDFAGNGRSTGKPSVETLIEDGVAALARLRELVGAEARVYLWGFSSGTGRALAVAARTREVIDGVVLMGPFTTSRALMLHYIKFVPPAAAGFLVPDYWDNRRLLEQFTAPVLIVHSRDDELVSFAHGEALARSCPDRVRLQAVAGLKHNQCWNPVHEDYWRPVFDITA